MIPDFYNYFRPTFVWIPTRCHCNVRNLEIYDCVVNNLTMSLILVVYILRLRWCQLDILVHSNTEYPTIILSSVNFKLKELHWNTLSISLYCGYDSDNHQFLNQLTGSETSFFIFFYIYIIFSLWMRSFKVKRAPLWETSSNSRVNILSLKFLSSHCLQGTSSSLFIQSLRQPS